MGIVSRAIESLKQYKWSGEDKNVYPFHLTSGMFREAAIELNKATCLDLEEQKFPTGVLTIERGGDIDWQKLSQEIKDGLGRSINEPIILSSHNAKFQRIYPLPPITSVCDCMKRQPSVKRLPARHRLSHYNRQRILLERERRAANPFYFKNEEEGS